MALQMAEAIKSRGPDDHGAWVDQDEGIALGHRRLSILDLSSKGRQPMVSHSGRYVIVYNGEIYNFQDIRCELEKTGVAGWRGHCDTEVILEAVEKWGLAGAAGRFNGMFALVVWDRKKRTLGFARDRLGKKPLYYGFINGIFFFASELKALNEHPGFNPEVDINSLALYLRHNYIPAPYSIYKHISKLPPGHIMEIPVNKLTRGDAPASLQYWSARESYERGESSPATDIESAVTELERLLKDCVGIRMISDVPLGAFLSGGIDSSLVVALMQAQSSQPVRTFTIGFHEKGYNEAEYAKQVAAYLGCDHTELYVTAQEAMSVIPDIPSIYDEPFSDSSQIPTYLVSRMARGYVTVSLSGDGGDESFGGYNRYLWAMSIWRKIGWAPAGVRDLMATILTMPPPSAWNMVYGLAEPIIPKRARIANPGDKVHKLAEILALSGPVEMYRWLVSHFKEPEKIVIGAREPVTVLSNQGAWADVDDFVRQMMFLDTITYLPDDILTKVDRASMAVSLEARAPLLDYRIVDFAATIPVGWNISDGQGKGLLRKVLYKHVPRELIERPKMGFGIPIDSWLRGPLKDWAESLINEKRLAEESFFNPAPVREKWEEHLSGKRNWQYYLWDILMFQAWLETYHG